MRDEQIVKQYIAGLSAKELGEQYKITPRQVQRIVSVAGVSRTISESYRLAIKTGRMKYQRKPEHMKVGRKRMSDKLRYSIMERDQFRCVLCGATAQECIRLEVDHIDEDKNNNIESNLQTLCDSCNKGKHYAKKIC